MTRLVRGRPGPWKRIVASRGFGFPAPDTGSVELVIDYRVPPEKFTALAKFDGGAIVEGTADDRLGLPRGCANAPLPSCPRRGRRP